MKQLMLAMVMLSGLVVRGAAADMITTPPYLGPWTGSLRCAAQNAGQVPRVLWVSVIEKDGGTIEARPACLNVPPQGVCEMVTADPRARSGRCQVQSNGPAKEMRWLVYSACDRHEGLRQ